MTELYSQIYKEAFNPKYFINKYIYDRDFNNLPSLGKPTYTHMNKCAEENSGPEQKCKMPILLRNNRNSFIYKCAGLNEPV